MSCDRCPACGESTNGTVPHHCSPLTPKVLFLSPEMVSLIEDVAELRRRIDAPERMLGVPLR
jgi:hypothetical protein